MRQLPFARLHYEDFCRLFSDRPVEKETSPAETTHQLPFCRYVTDQTRDCLSLSPNSLDTTIKETVSLTLPKDDSTYTDTLFDRGCQKEGDIEVGNELSESSESEDETESEHAWKSDTDLQQDRGKENSLDSKLTDPTADNDKAPSPSLSEEYLSASESENKTPTKSMNTINPPSTHANELTTIAGDKNDDEEGNAHPLDNQDAMTGDEHQTPPTTLTSAARAKDAKELGNAAPANGETPEDILLSPQMAASMFKAASTGQLAGAVSCAVCKQLAYPAERFEADGQVVHMTCFRCHRCSTMLQRAAWNLRESQYYCNPCHRRIALQTLRH